MDNRLWRVLAVVFGLLFIVIFGLVILFGVRLAQNNAIKDREAEGKLTEQEAQLKEEFQKTLEEEGYEYTADEVFGSFKFTYPKVWSTNITKDEGSQEELIFLADPELITVDNKNKNTVTALRVIFYKVKYEEKLREVEGRNDSTKLLTESDTEISDISGKAFLGKDEATGNNIAFTLIPVRDKTLYIGTDNYPTYRDQYEKILNSFNISK